MAINLLPQEQKKELKLEIVQRKVSLLLLFLLIFFIFLILTLSWEKLYIVRKVNSSEILILEKEKELKTSQLQNFKTKVANINQNLSKIQGLNQEKILLQPILEKLSSCQPQGIYFTNLSLRKTELHLDGFSQSRAILFSFKKTLELKEGFEDIYFLPSSWVKPFDVNFSLSLKFVP